MAVKKKPTTRKPSVAKKQEVLLTEQEVYNVLEFAQNAYNMFNGVYTPDLVNARMKDITMNPAMATADNISAALRDPKNNEQNLIGYSEFLELSSMLYKRILLYFSGLLSFDWTYVCTNIKDEKEYDTPAYKKDLLVFQDFFDRFDVKNAFKTAMRQMLRNEAYYAVFRDEGERYHLQELPQNYCKITGRYDYGFVFDFNMYWFWQVGVSIDMYPPVFKKFFRKTFGDNADITKYNPALEINARTGSWVYWTQTSPKDGFTCFKLTPEVATLVPFLSPFMPDAVLQPIIRALQTDSYIAEASKIILGQVEFIKDASSKVKDALTLAPETLGKFLALLKAGLPSAIKVGAAPLANMAGVEFKGNTELYDSFLSTAASSAGINSRLIYSKDRQNILETKLSMDIDQNIVRPVYAQFGNQVGYWANQRTKKYKFKVMFEGFETSTDRDMRFERVNKLGEQGIVLEQKYAASIGLSPFDFRRLLAEGRINKFVERLTPIMKSSQMPAAEGKAKGRPAMKDSELGDSGAESREDGSNDENAEE